MLTFEAFIYTPYQGIATINFNELESTNISPVKGWFVHNPSMQPLNY